jgi:hypothetical protein
MSGSFSTASENTLEAGLSNTDAPKPGWLTDIDGEGVGLLEKGLGCTLPESKQETGFRLAPLAPRSIPMKRIPAAEQTREQLRALKATWDSAGTVQLGAAGDAVDPLGSLGGRVRDRIGRERYERADGEAKGYRNGYRPGRIKTASSRSSHSPTDCPARGKRAIHPEHLGDKPRAIVGTEQPVFIPRYERTS